MAKFIPSEHVETIEWDFTEYGGETGVVPEPSTGTVKAFFKSMKDTMKEAQATQAKFEHVQAEDITDEEAAAMLDQVDEAEEGAEELALRTIRNLAALCGGVWMNNEDGSMRVEGGSPDVENLQKLPHRVLQAFATWLVTQISPKAQTQGTRPSPMDRQRSTT